MLGILRSAARWVGAHSLPAAAATVLVMGAAGGGIGYSIAGQHTTAAPVRSTAPSTGTPPTTTPPAKGKGAAGAPRAPGQALLGRALQKLSAELNVPVATLRTELKTESIDQVVTAAGKDPSAIEQDILAQLKARADRAVAAHKITSQQEQTFLATAKTGVDKLLADAPAQRAADLKTLVQAIRAHHAAAPAATPAAG